MELSRHLLDLLYPPKCPFCGRLLERGEDGLCAQCQQVLPWTRAADGKEVGHCAACLSPLWYQDGVREAVHRYKFDDGMVHAAVFGKLMAQCLNDRQERPADLIVWVPLHPARRRERGFDQAELLARRVGELTGLPVISALGKVRRTGAQSQIQDESARWANVEGVYALRPEAAAVAGMHVVLVDDVATSGATLAQCAALLRQTGAESVTALTLARAR